MDSIEAATVTQALGDASRDVRVSAIRIAERWLRQPANPVQAAVLNLMSDRDWAVRQQLGASLGELPQTAKDSALATFLEQHATDPVALDAALSGLAGSERAVLERLLKANDETPQRSTAITMVAATIVSGGQDAAVQALLETISQSGRPGWQQSALLRGAEVSLLGAAAPGAPAGGRGAGRGAEAAADAPCPTCPGGRAGPGGAPAFARGRAAGAGAAAPEAPAEGGGRAAGGGGRGRGGARPALKLTREPALTRRERGGARAAGELRCWPASNGPVSRA